MQRTLTELTYTEEEPVFSLSQVSVEVNKYSVYRYSDPSLADNPSLGVIHPSDTRCMTHTPTDPEPYRKYEDIGEVEEDFRR